MEWNSHTSVADGPDIGTLWSVLSISRIKMVTSRLVRVGKISFRYFAIRTTGRVVLDQDVRNRVKSNQDTEITCPFAVFSILSQV